MGNTSPHQELKEKAREVIRVAVRDFSWSSYGLDDVEEADPEWQGDLALEIANELFGKDIK